MNFNLSINGESAAELANLGVALATLSIVKTPDLRHKADTTTKVEEPNAEGQTAETAPEPVAEKQAAPVRTRKATPKVEEPKAEETTAPGETTDLSLEDVRAAVRDLTSASPDKREKVKELLSTFSVGRVTDLPSEHFSDFITKLKAV